jgi:hypothetical protein
MTAFEDLLAEVMASADRFGHRQHVHLTWLAVQQDGVDAAVTLVSDGIQRTARYAGAPQKYHATISRAWVQLVGHHVQHHPNDDFATFALTNAALLDKKLLTRFYRPSTLASAAAKQGWVEPDLSPFPWQAERPPSPGSPRAGRLIADGNVNTSHPGGTVAHVTNPSSPADSPVTRNPFQAADPPGHGAAVATPSQQPDPGHPAPLVFSHDPARLAAQAGAPQAAPQTYGSAANA